MKYFSIIIFFFVSMVFTGCKSSHINGPAKVEISNYNGKYQLQVNGKPYFIKGAGLEFGKIKSLAAHGGNTFRTWRTENGKDDAIAVLDSAKKYGLMVLMGLEVGRERHGYDYNDTAWVKKQFEYLKGEVLRLKDHSALLGWAIGNELNLFTENLKVYDAVNDISKMIHAIDPNHPTTTTLAGIGKREVDYIKQHCTDIDFISVQMYADIINLQQRLANAGWDGPYMVTEWGATGHWEVASTEWKANIEQTSHEKAIAFLERYTKAIAADPARCLGSFVFIWGQKQERTPTWYGMFLETSEETETIDAMHYIWNGTWPSNRCPVLDSLKLNGKTAYENVKVKKGAKLLTEVAVRELDNDTLIYSWELLPESSDLGTGGDREKRPASIFNVNASSSFEFKAPADKGAYRIFAYIRDGKGHAATANIPFYVE